MVSDNLILEYFGKEKPVVSVSYLVHRPSDLDKTKRWREFRRYDQVSHSQIADEISDLTTNFYPYLYEVVAPAVYRRWRNVFLKSWRRRFTSRWMNSGKMKVIYPGVCTHYLGLSAEMVESLKQGRVPEFGYDSYESGCNLPHFRRYLQAVSRGSSSDHIWSGNFLALMGWLSYVYPEGVNSSYQFHIPYRGLDSYDWTLSKSEITDALETRVIV